MTELFLARVLIDNSIRSSRSQGNCQDALALVAFPATGLVAQTECFQGSSR